MTVMEIYSPSCWFSKVGFTLAYLNSLCFRMTHLLTVRSVNLKCVCVVLFVTQSVQTVVLYRLPNESLAHCCCVISVRDQSGGPSSP